MSLFIRPMIAVVQQLGQQNIFQNGQLLVFPNLKKRLIPNIIALDTTTVISKAQEKDYGRSISFNIQNQKNTEVLIRRYYFPGWSVLIDMDKTQIKPYGKEGLIKIGVPPGSHAVKAIWQGTLTENASNWVTFISMLLVMIAVVGYWRSKKLL